MARKRGESYEDWQARRQRERLAFTVALREIEGLVEKQPGNFHFRSRAFLHFHGGDTGRVADVKLGPEWVRRPAETPRQLDALRKEVAEYVASNRPSRRSSTR